MPDAALAPTESPLAAWFRDEERGPAPASALRSLDVPEIAIQALLAEGMAREDRPELAWMPETLADAEFVLGKRAAIAARREQIRHAAALAEAELDREDAWWARFDRDIQRLAEENYQRDHRGETKQKHIHLPAAGATVSTRTNPGIYQVTDEAALLEHLRITASPEELERIVRVTVRQEYWGERGLKLADTLKGRPGCSVDVKLIHKWALDWHSRVRKHVDEDGVVVGYLPTPGITWQAPEERMDIEFGPQRLKAGK